MSSKLSDCYCSMRIIWANLWFTQGHVHVPRECVVTVPINSLIKLLIVKIKSILHRSNTLHQHQEYINYIPNCFLIFLLHIIRVQKKKIVNDLLCNAAPH